MLLSAGWVAAELQGDCIVVASDGVSWLDVGVSSTGQIMNHLLPVCSTATQDVIIINPTVLFCSFGTFSVNLTIYVTNKEHCHLET